MHVSRGSHLALAASLALCLVVLNVEAQSPSPAARQPGGDLLPSAADYEDKVYASWLGQIIGNIAGLVHENRYIDEPGPDTYPFDHGPNLERLRDANGAFSDDDTDIEYMYLLQMDSTASSRPTLSSPTPGRITFATASGWPTGPDSTRFGRTLHPRRRGFRRARRAASGQ